MKTIDEIIARAARDAGIIDWRGLRPPYGVPTNVAARRFYLATPRRVAWAAREIRRAWCSAVADAMIR